MPTVYEFVNLRIYAGAGAAVAMRLPVGLAENFEWLQSGNFRQKFHVIFKATTRNFGVISLEISEQTDF